MHQSRLAHSIPATNRVLKGTEETTLTDMNEDSKTTATRTVIGLSTDLTVMNTSQTTVTIIQNGKKQP